MMLYGVKNCDTVKKARAWLSAEGIEYRFHDFRVDGLDAALLESFERAAGWEILLNRRGTSWRGLSDEQRADVDRGKALALMLAHPALIKRPVLNSDSKIVVGFTPEKYAAELKR
ncbi:ArsC family reductase [Candidatus Methylospira mobilis]|uniref:ArsC family reductase n=1 Tax=Candidatus Methylospira mobilis TaxID=1808979 RepID=A0A5Q0BI17_9GAMM|nr:ArsC family reductase [Candidatus Methylospira mobilis]QFY43463.1 ArsC family reductase [Candidatus Methylospira mobilis]WNV03994.1 ArsC family reductase [Candidatus Methylospira mobilis]